MKSFTGFKRGCFYCLAGVLLVFGLVAITGADEAGYGELKIEAEKLFGEGSYGLARKVYLKADVLELSAEEARWVDFRLADTMWRSQAGTQTADNTEYEQARKQLEELIRDVNRPEEQNRAWAEAQESLGDFWWTRRNSQNWHQAWPYYQKALDWWAGAKEIELARGRYIKIVWNIAMPSWSTGRNYSYYYYGYYGNILPLEILENVLKIAQKENDKARAHYLIAMTLRRGGDWQKRERVVEEFEAALKLKRSTDWYDDALYHYAEWLVSNGRAVLLKDGGWQMEPDYIRALELFRRLVTEHQKGETRYFDQAKERIKEITGPKVNIRVSHIFLPGSEIQFYLNWRNVDNINFTLYKVNLSEDVEFLGSDAGNSQWLEHIDLSRSRKVKAWSKAVENKGKHKPRQETARLDDKLPLGAYVLEAKSQDARSRELILVTDASIVMRTSGKQALVYFANALDGSPINRAVVELWERRYNGQKWIWRRMEKETDKDGICVFDLSDTSNNLELFAGAAFGNRQAFSIGNSYNYNRQKDKWRVYASCDRPAYRPEEKVSWKFIARRYDGAVYSTPAHQTVEFEIRDPRGSEVKKDKVKLNAFGSAWGSLELTESMPLGEYRVIFWDEKRSNYIGEAVLFRLEEYKLPEFKVSIQTPREKGQRKAFCLGDIVEVDIQADYYFGGAVANADVEVVVYQNPFYHFWQTPRDFPWYYENTNSYRSYYGDGQVIKREKIKTDAAGKAVLKFETPKNARQDFEYRVEARVTDASRREIIANETVRVTRQAYYVYFDNKHNLYRPQDKVEVDIKTLDANNQPVPREGVVRVTRDYWYEVWETPDGREVKGRELKRLRGKYGIFPPSPAKKGNKRWRLKFSGYEQDVVLTRTIKTDVEGKAEFTFTPEREGYYRISWTSRDKRNTPINSQTTVWVAVNATTELSYRPGGVEIIVDKDTFNSGQKAAVMLSVPTNGRYVLFSVEGDDLYSYRLIHLTGTVKLIELPVEQKHVPNIFLNAVMVADGQLFTDTKQVIVPPVEHFLEVEVKSDREEYEPRDEGTLTITTRDHQGRPVSAEVALGLVDESVYYIQKDYAPDPRQFYYGTKRGHAIRMQSTFYQKSYMKLVEGDKNQLIDEKILRRLKLEERDKIDHKYSYDSFGGNINGVERIRVSGDLSVMDACCECSEESGSMMQSKKKIVGREFKLCSGMASGGEPAVQVRSDFRSTIFWQPDIITGKDGKAEVKVKFADSLTGWKASARVVSRGNQFGTASTNMRTKKPLIVRLQAPRFFVVGDEVTVSAVINNNTNKPINVSPNLEAEGLTVKGVLKDGKLKRTDRQQVKVDANGEARIDWLVAVEKAGEVKLMISGRGGKHSDAMEKKYFAYEHGIEKFVSKSGKTRSDEVVVKLNIPKERRPETTTLNVQITPSMAVTMLDALPYLIDYPYGCTEQTLSRFLPAVITAKTLNDLGIEPEVIAGKIFGGIEEEYAGKTHPKGKKDLKKLDKMVKEGLVRLYDFQHSDGGWGWWKKGESDHYMTAYAVWGLALAQESGIKVKKDVLRRGADYLDKEIVEEEDSYDMQAWMLHALSSYHASIKQHKVGKLQVKAFENLWKNKDRLNAYTRALLALSADNYGYTEKAKILVQNLANGVKVDTSPDTSVIQRGRQQSHKAVIGTAHWGEDGVYWRWSEGGVEATAFALQALLTIDSQNELIEPVTNWLIKNRRGAQWSNTRDTAITILTLNRYLRQSGELEAGIEYELFVNNKLIAKKKITKEDIFSAPSVFEIDRALIKNGVNEIRVRRKKGNGPLYFAARAKFFSLEEPITACGNEIFVRRQYYKLVGRPTLLKGYVYDKQPLNDEGMIKSGERVEVVLTIEAKNNYEYLVFEDLKPAGFEAVQLQSGEPLYARELKSGAVEYLFGSSEEDAAILPPEPDGSADDYTGRRRWIYQELRDRKVVLFIDKLPEGVWEIRYNLRAEVPGKFHALPVLGHAMYVPEIRANGREARITVEE